MKPICNLQQIMPDQTNEEAFTICGCNQGLARGSQAKGDYHSVSLEVECPHGYRALGIFHSHPQGHPTLSEADIREARRLGLHHMCVGVPQTGEIVCHEV